MAKRMFETGPRYRDVQPGIYGRSSASDWIAEALVTDAFGIRHARLVSVADPSEPKTLAAEVLADPTRFEEVQPRHGRSAAGADVEAHGKQRVALERRSCICGSNRRAVERQYPRALRLLPQPRQLGELYSRRARSCLVRKIPGS
jgi:hypothetical protein